MRSVPCAWGLLLVLLGTASAHSHHEDLLEEMHVTPFAALDALQAPNATGDDVHKHCKVTCDGPSGLQEVSLTDKGHHCFGTFRVFCKFEVHNHTAIAGTKCEGSFGGFESRDDGRVFLKCDGKMVHWGVMTLPHPPHGHHDEKHDDDDAHDEDAHPPSFPHPPPPKGPIKLISVHGIIGGCIGTQTLMMTHPKHADGAPPMLSTDANDVLEAAWERVEDSGVVNGNFTPVAEGRCDGTSFAVKKAHPARPHPPGEKDGDKEEETVEVMGMQSEALVDEEVDTIQHPSLLQRLSDWLLPQYLPGELFAPEPPCEGPPDGPPTPEDEPPTPEDEPPTPEDQPEGPPHGPPHKGPKGPPHKGPKGPPHKPPHGPPHKGPKPPPHKGPKPPPHKGPKGPPHKFPGHCELRCNGRRTFMHGALPCVGVFEAHCDFDVPPHPHGGHGKHHNDTEGEPRKQGKPRALLHSHSHDHDHYDHHHNMSHPICAHKKHHKKHHQVHVDGKCEGIFTGRFMGTKCRGFSYGAIASPRGQVVATCSRAHFVRAGPMPGGLGVRSVCTDKSMLVVLRADGEGAGAAGGGDVTVE